MSAIKNISFSMMTNIWTLLINVGLNFVTPYFIAVEDFGHLRTFMLYASFSGIMHLGFIDGIYLQFGGVNIASISRRYFYQLKKFYYLMQGVFSLLFFVIGLLNGREIICLFALSSLFINLFNFGNYFYQSVNEFKIFSKVNFVTNLFLGLSIIFVFYISKASDYRYVIYSLILSYMLGFVLYEFFYRKKLLNNSSNDEQSMLANFISILKMGGLILVGNLLYVYLLMADKFIVNLFFDKEIFAYYSFSGSIIAIVIALITSVSMALYPILVQNYTIKSIAFLKVFTLISSVIGLSTYFLAALLINIAFKKYIPSVELLRYMILILPAISIIGVVSVNFYKINKLGLQYVKDLILITIFGAAVYFSIYFLFRTTISIAIASFICLNFALWYINKRNELFTFTQYDITYYLSNTVLFLLISNFIPNIYAAGLLFLGCCTILTFIVYSKQLKEFYVKIMNR